VLRQPEMVNKLVLVSTSARVVSSSRSGLMLNFFHLLPLSRDMQPHYAFVRQMEASRLYDASARLSEINIPVIILHGKTDKIVPDYLAEEFHTGIRSSKMVTLPGGHLFFMLRSRRPFLEELLRFLG
jgi:pimeloyl-ACP methyl ester carboxylesterase